MVGSHKKDKLIGRELLIASFSSEVAKSQLKFHTSEDNLCYNDYVQLCTLQYTLPHSEAHSSASPRTLQSN